MKNCILFITILIAKISFSQYQDVNWFFGDSCMIKFETGEIISYKVSGVADETSVSISDNLGNLLFYSDGSIVFNRNYEPMSNSYLDQWQYTEGLGSSVTQGAVIIPDPVNEKQYYIIHHAEEGMRYSILDMALNGGFGDIKMDARNVSIIDTNHYNITEKLTAVKHANGRDWWVLFHYKAEDYNPDSANTFAKILISPSGVSGPYSQVVGGTGASSVSEMVFSPQGDKLAYIKGYSVEVFDFDRCTGDLALNINTIDTIGGIPEFAPYSCAFSPDGSKLYVSSVTEIGGKIYQYDLNEEGDINATQTLIYKETYNDYAIGQMELGPDGKVYFVIFFYTWYNNYFTNKNMNLSVINYPNLAGLACDVDTLTINLGGRRALFSLPNMVNYNLGALAGSECDTLVSIDADLHQHDKFGIYPNPASDKINLSSNTNTILFYSIKNNLGAEMITGSFIRQKTIEIKFLTSGIYFIEIKNEKGEIVFTEKMVKQ